VPHSVRSFAPPSLPPSLSLSLPLTPPPPALRRGSVARAAKLALPYYIVRTVSRANLLPRDWMSPVDLERSLYPRYATRRDATRRGAARRGEERHDKTRAARRRDCQKREAARVALSVLRNALWGRVRARCQPVDLSRVLEESYRVSYRLVTYIPTAFRTRMPGRELGGGRERGRGEGRTVTSLENESKGWRESIKERHVVLFFFFFFFFFFVVVTVRYIRYCSGMRARSRRGFIDFAS